jgi:facilitated trehalose transporter
MKPSRSSLRQQKSNPNDSVALESGDGITTLAVNPIIDSEDEKEDDGSLVPAPNGH